MWQVDVPATTARRVHASPSPMAAGDPDFPLDGS